MSLTVQNLMTSENWKIQLRVVNLMEKKSSKGKDTIEAIYVIFSITYKSFQFKRG